jgi:hypothetical protein
MMFYDIQDNEKVERYKSLLKLIGQLSRLFSDSDKPFLHYRIHENFFCESFASENLGRSDVSIDAKLEAFGIGLKTWVGSNSQKIAEFNRLSHKFQGLSDEDLIRIVSEYRNDRLIFTRKSYGVDKLIYHVVKRDIESMEILETGMHDIDLNNLVIDHSRGNNSNVYFADGRNFYHFSKSKNTLYKNFDDLIRLDQFEVRISENPIEFLESNTIIEKKIIDGIFNEKPLNRIALRLYSQTKKGKIVYTKSGLNGWNASGRKRDINEIYIPYPKEDRNITKDFFPPKDKSFNLLLPNGDKLSAKVCQQDGKAIMSNPNKALGKWLLRDLLDFEEGRILKYDDLERIGVDTVIFTKIDNNNYRLEFAELGYYEGANFIDEEI